MQSWRKGVASKGNDSVSNASPKVLDTDTKKEIPDVFDEDLPKKELTHSTAPLQFFGTCSNLTKKFMEYFPEDAETLKPTLALMGFSGDEVEEKDALEMGTYMMKSFFEMFNESFDLIMERNEKFFEIDSSILQSMNVKEKWSKLTLEQKDASWSDLVLLVQLTNIGKMYDLCPSKMMNMISNMAQKVSGQVQKGELNLETLNPMEIGQSLVSSMSEEEIHEIGKSLMKKENLDDMMKLMQTSMKGMQNMKGMPKNFDMGALSSLGSLTALTGMLNQGNSS